MYLLSANGTLRTILILLIIWQLLRLWMKVSADRSNSGTARTHWTTDAPRPKGEVRIEKVADVQHSAAPLEVEDADFEVIKDHSEPEG